MPPIPIHKDAPIAPAAGKPDGVTPSTASSNPQNPPPTRTTPAYAPATTTQDSSNPPPPQPGARPITPTASAQNHDASSPAPPQPGPTATIITTESRLGGPPQQFTLPPPNDSALAGRSTTTSTTASKPGPTTLDFGPVASPYQFADAQSAAPTRTSLEHPPGYVQAPNNAPYTQGGRLGAQAGQDGETGGVGSAAWNMLSKAGEALKKGEEAAWKAVRNK